MEWNAVAEEIMKPLEELLVEIKEVAIHAHEISIEMDAALSSVRRDIESLLDSDVNQRQEPGDYEIITPVNEGELIMHDGTNVRKESLR